VGEGNKGSKKQPKNAGEKERRKKQPRKVRQKETRKRRREGIAVRGN